MSLPHLAPWQWLLGGACALGVGMAKTGVPGLGILVVPLMVLAVGDARQSAGWLLPLLCVADVFAVAAYRRHAEARQLFSLVPWVLVGMGAGALALGGPESMLRRVVGAIVMAMVVLRIARGRPRPVEDSAPPPAAAKPALGAAIDAGPSQGPAPPALSLGRAKPALGAAIDAGPSQGPAPPALSLGRAKPALGSAIDAGPSQGPAPPALSLGRAKPALGSAIGYGVVAGFATTLANAAGPVMNLYLLARRLPKQQFIATGAWFFLVINLSKLPIYAGHGLIHTRSLLFDLVLVPPVLLGAAIGRRVAARLPQQAFELLVLALTAAAAALLMLR